MAAPPSQLRASQKNQSACPPATGGVRMSSLADSAMKNAPAASSHSQARRPGWRQAPMTPAAQNGPGPASIQPAPDGSPRARSTATVATSATAPTAVSPAQTARITSVCGRRQCQR